MREEDGRLHGDTFGFQILLSCLELNTISGVPLLRVTKLPLNNPFNWALNRAIDIVGSFVGLVLSAPIIATLRAARLLGVSRGRFFYGNIRSAAAVATFTS